MEATEVPSYLIRVRACNVHCLFDVVYSFQCEGGPGVSGVEQLLSSAAAFQTIIGDDFDIVSFDPRGSDSTNPDLDDFH